MLHPDTEHSALLSFVSERRNQVREGRIAAPRPQSAFLTRVGDFLISIGTMMKRRAYRGSLNNKMPAGIVEVK